MIEIIIMFLAKIIIVLAFAIFSLVLGYMLLRDFPLTLSSFFSKSWGIKRFILLNWLFFLCVGILMYVLAVPIFLFNIFNGIFLS